MFKWGVLSGAKIATENMMPAIAQSRNGNILGIACRRREDADSIAARFNIAHVFSDYEALLASPNIDGVYIPVATAHHMHWATRAAQAGKHVLCEKPIAMAASEMDDLIKLRDDTGLMICEAYMVYYHPQWQKVRELIAQGAIGTLSHIHGAFCFHNIDPKSTRNSVELGGGGLRDIGVYPIVTARIATGQEPKRLRGETQFSPEFGTDIFSNATVEFDGFSMSFYCSTQLANFQEMSFHGDMGRIHLSAPFNAGQYDHARVNVFDGRDNSETSFSYSDVRQYRLEAEAFVDAINGVSADCFTLENSVANQRVIDAVFRASQSGGWEDV